MYKPIDNGIIFMLLLKVHRIIFSKLIYNIKARAHQPKKSHPCSQGCDFLLCEILFLRIWFIKNEASTRRFPFRSDAFGGARGKPLPSLRSVRGFTCRARSRPSRRSALQPVKWIYYYRKWMIISILSYIVEKYFYVIDIYVDWSGRRWLLRESSWRTAFASNSADESRID